MMKKLILTALDNNEDIWFDCFIPFIITLNNTNYSSDIGVICYGLSDDKRKILSQNNIHLFEAENICNDLSLDRFLSAAYIAKDYDLVALYDADIWFPKENLTLFSHINTTHFLYCCYDVIIPPFLLNGVVNNKSLIQTKLNKLLEKQSYYWQAGLTVGHNHAWQEYAAFIINSLNTGDYQSEYGIDTTLLNLYSLEFERIRHLHEKYNCLPFWGIEIDKAKFFPLKVKNEEIEGLHITRFHRDTSDFSFFKVASDLYLNQGSKFSIHKTPLYHYEHCGKLFQDSNYSSENTFYCEELFCHSLSYDRTNEIISIKAIDTFEMKLTYTGKEICLIQVGYQAILNTPLPIKIKLYLNDKEIDLLKDNLITLSINPRDELIIQSLHLRNNFGVNLLLNGVDII